MFNNEKSNEFLINEGVKQGGILSPYSFNFYVNDLIKSCVDANLGANIDCTNLSIIAYCDDIIILSPIAFHVQTLLSIITDYSKKWIIEFNPSKSGYMSYNEDIVLQNYDFKIGGKVIPKQEGIIYLGLPIKDQNYINQYVNEK
ncbi:unnamed protein product [Brachionus calyciflorus]|uniref:Reverse transcriptase domain-containing protein n=1 Tax=Brachionus calyciflorus TaxID=104777 RepID=A0A814MM55_9BILA|nr:unnamed protein product [Brachionus calyciflorus]